MSILPKFFYRFNAIPIKTLARIFVNRQAYSKINMEKKIDMEEIGAE